MNSKKESIQMLLTAIICILSIVAQAKKPVPIVTRVDPPNWWVGMADKHLELVLHGPQIQQYELALAGTSTVVENITLPPNPDYIFVKLLVGKDQPPGDLVFTFKGKKKEQFEYHYPLLQRSSIEIEKGLSSSDLVYMVFPDRFANGDSTNDFFPDMNEKICDRSGLKSRHGGDIAGIVNHLDYFTDLGATALWINPVIDNDQGYESYHGYAATDLYKIDPRFGSNSSYKSLVDKCHEKGLKIIWDVVYNHWGNENWLFRNLPDSNWVHWFDEFTRTSYRAEVLLDPYASEYDKKIMTDAWFDKHMPDLNQQDVHLSSYLIQNSIWWIEYAGIDAFRIDTYAYPDQQFMKLLNEAIRLEYPDFVLFGETWVQGTPTQSWFTEEAYVKKDYNSSLHGVTDFQLFYAITKGLNEPFGWEEGFRRIEMTLAQDVLYKNPSSLVTFLDNHDLSRFYSAIGENFDKYKMGMAMLYTLRGIPSIYYGTEILMKNFADPDAKVREDFPGGWAGDKYNKFTAEGRSEAENSAYSFCKTLGQWRRSNAWIGKAKLTQFVPENNSYVYFRHDGSHSLMCAYNGNSTAIELELNRFDECINNKTKATDIFSGKKTVLAKRMTIAANTVLILEIN